MAQGNRKRKGNASHAKLVTPRSSPYSSNYLQVRAHAPEPALFVGAQGRRLSQTIMTQTFLRYARAAGVTERKRVKPRTLRHVFASELLRAGANLRQVQGCSGTSTSTRRSATRVSPRTSCEEPSSDSSSNAHDATPQPRSQVHSGGGIWTDINVGVPLHRGSAALIAF
ncbi:MAG: tyrosine-type recombinase/integrase [Gaiellaceae bacterium]